MSNFERIDKIEHDRSHYFKTHSGNSTAKQKDDMNIDLAHSRCELEKKLTEHAESEIVKIRNIEDAATEIAGKDMSDENISDSSVIYQPPHKTEILHEKYEKIKKGAVKNETSKSQSTKKTPKTVRC